MRKLLSRKELNHGARPEGGCRAGSKSCHALRGQDKQHGRGRGMTPPLQITTGIPTRGVRTDLESQNPEQNTVQDKYILHKEEGEKQKTETKSKETQST